MKNFDSDQTLNRLIHLLLESLDEINEPMDSYDNPDFILGLKTAYVECLEIIQDSWEPCVKCGMPDNIEKKYPI